MTGDSYLVFLSRNFDESISKEKKKKNRERQLNYLEPEKRQRWRKLKYLQPIF